MTAHKRARVGSFATEQEAAVVLAAHVRAIESALAGAGS